MISHELVTKALARLVLIPSNFYIRENAQMGGAVLGMLNSEIMEFMVEVNSAMTRDQIWNSTTRFFASKGLETVSFFDLKSKNSVFRSTLPDWWLKYYLDQGYAEVDSLLDYCSSNMRVKPAGIEFIECRGKLSAKQRQIICDVSEVGAKAGFTCTSRERGPDGMAVWAIFGDMKAQDMEHLWAEQGEVLKLATHLSYNAMQKLTNGQATPDPKPLEQEYLRHLIGGLSPKEATFHISFRPHEANFHLSMARRKLASNSNDQLVAKALAQKVIGL